MENCSGVSVGLQKSINFTKYDLTYFSSWVDSSLVGPQGHISRRPKGIEALKTLVNKQCLVIHFV